MEVMKNQQNLLPLLKELHSSLQHTDHINVNGFLKKYNLCRMMGARLRDKGIIKSNGLRGEGCRYEWTAGEPNEAMAEFIAKRKGHEWKDGIVPNRKNVKNNLAVKKEVKETSPKIKVHLFWGAIKIEL